MLHFRVKMNKTEGYTDQYQLLNCSEVLSSALRVKPRAVSGQEIPKHASAHESLKYIKSYIQEYQTN